MFSRLTIIWDELPEIIMQLKKNLLLIFFKFQVEGVLSGDLTLLLNMTIEGQSGYMSLITTSTAALFTMPGITNGMLL